MSNERHLEIDSGKMGNVFRRMTLATLGLDDLEGVSEQSFDVVERADSFAERLFDNLSHVMPKVSTGRFESRATELSEHIYAGMAGMHGPKNATDLGDWQYWLDAALLMLFDEDEEEDELAETGTSTSSSRTASQHSVNANRVVKATPEAIRTRIAALKQSGVTPQMLHSMRQSEKRSLIENVQRILAEHKPSSDNTHSKMSSLNSDSDNLNHQSRLEEESRFVAQLIVNKLQSSSKTELSDKQVGFLTQQTQTQMLSHLSDQVLNLSAGLLNTTVSVQGSGFEAFTRISETARRIVSGEHLEPSAVHEVLANVSELEKAGMISHVQADEIRRAGHAYRQQVYREFFGQDNVISRAEQMGNRVSSMASGAVSSLRALSVRDAHHTIDAQNQIISHTLGVIHEKLNELNHVVSERVLQSGDSASTVKWQRVSERFERMHGISDEADRVLLRDVLESAAELGEAGIIPQHLVQDMAASFIRASEKTTESHHSLPAERIGQQFIEKSISESGVRVLNQIVGRVEESISSLVDNLSKTGISADKTAGFVSEIRALTNAGKDLAISNATTSVVDASSVLASISERLDAFTQTVSSDVTTLGYDELTSESSTFVSMDEPADNTEIRNVESAVSAVRQLQQQMMRSQEKARSEIREMLSQHMTREQIPAEILSQLTTASSVSNLENVQNQIASHLNTEQRQYLSKTIDAIRKSETHLEKVAQQLQVIERAAQLSSGLKKVISEGKVDVPELGNLMGTVSGHPLSVGDVQIQAQYLNSLKETLASYQRLQNHYSVSGAEKTELNTAMNDHRINQMLSLIQTGNQERVQNFGLADINLQSTEALSRFIRYADQRGISSSHGMSLGYDTLANDHMDWIKPASLSAMREREVLETRDNTVARNYPSQSVAGDLSNMIGTKRAIEFHTSELAQGQSVKAAQELGQAIQRWAEGNSHEQVFTTYSLNDAGEQVKLSLNLSKTSKDQSGYELRQSSGQAYQPKAIRNAHDFLSPVSAALSMSPNISSRQMTSGATEFVPVIAGASEKASASETADTFAPSLHANFSVPMSLASTDMTGRIRLNVQNVSYELSPSDFVQMVAKPAIASASMQSPSLMNADHALFSGYAALMQSQGDRRSLKSLKRSYLESVSRSGAQSVHAEVGFSSQNFTDILGVTDTMKSIGSNSASGQMPGYAENAEHIYVDDSQNTSAFETESQRSTQAMVDEFVSGRSQVVTSQADDVNYSWVSNKANIHVAHGANGVDLSSSTSGNQQILSRIDNMLDYVENMSTREVGVFSTNETVRVLLESLPEDGYLGDKGLPKWRQRNTKAARAAEARELREALAKIGASPVQGVQRLNDRHFVSPNLIQNNGTQAAPLFSGGSDSANASSPVSTLERTSERTYQSNEIPEEDLQYIADKVYEEIVKSLIEEIQRGREK